MTTHTISDGPVQFTEAGGEVIGAHLATPEGNGPFPGIVVIQEVWGVSEFIKETTRRFAAQGYLVIAPDLYSRLDNPDVSTLALARKAIGVLSDAQVVQDLQGATDYLRDLPGFSGRIGVIGFCAGGRYTTIFAARGTGIDAAITCYGPIMPNDISGPDLRPVPPIGMAAYVQCPLLGLYAEHDTIAPPEDVIMYDAALTEHGKFHEFHVYPDTGHAFMDIGNPSYSAEHAPNAWAKASAWFDEYLK